MIYFKNIHDKRILLCFSLFFLLLCSNTLLGQKSNTGFKMTKANLRTVAATGYVRCATVEYEKKLAESNPNKISKTAFESWMSTRIAQVKKSTVNGKIANQVYNIPVVVHVIHNGDEVNSAGNIVGENISDAQVISQIEVLNQDFRKQLGTPGGRNSTGVAVDVEINFCLAQQDPTGIETTGIVRHQITPYTDDVANESTNNIGGGGVDWETYEDVQRLKRETQWNPNKYLNIWTIRTGGESTDDGGLDGLLGYAQFPSNSNLPGLDAVEGSSDTDGVVISYHAFGDSKKSDGSFVMNNIYNEGRTTTHEVGHWLGLRHIWGDTETCENDDYCADTPDATHENTSCDEVDSCPLDGLGNDMVQNYMDYTADPCMDTFTQDQKNRMIAVLNNSPRRVELLTSTACEPPLYSTKDLEEFIVDPNPFTDKITVSGFADGIVKLSIYNASGQLFYSEKYYNVEDVFSEEIEINYLVSGVYIVFIENDSHKVVKRIIKK